MFALDNWPKAKKARRPQIGDFVVGAYMALDRKAHLYEGFVQARFSGMAGCRISRKSAP
jgi:hypothetical protein